MTSRPNIVLITCDQWRGDCLGVSGHPVVETPHLDNMARQGVNFTRAYTACPSCIAARAGILTGLAPRSHGRVGYRDGVDWNYEITLPGELARAGYHTQGVGKMHFHPPRSLMGFHNVVLHDGYLHHERRLERNADLVDDYWPWLKDKVDHEVDYAATGLAANSWVARPWHLDERLHPTNWVVTKSMEFLKRRDRRRPFFLWMSFVRPHAPLDPPAFYLDQYLSQEMPPPPLGDWADNEDAEREGLDANARRGIIGDRQLRRATAAYYALMTHIDHQVGRFVEAVGEDGSAANTVWLFAADHGEMMGDHNLFRKALPYEGSARVPFILRAPEPLGLRALAESRALVELRDIMPTLLELAGVDVPPSIEGKSLLPAARGESDELRQYVHGEHAYGQASNHFLVGADEKYIWFSQDGREQLFDLDADPQEAHDLAGAQGRADHLEHWRSILARELAGREEGYSDGKKLIPGRPPTAILKETMPEP